MQTARAAYCGLSRTKFLDGARRSAWEHWESRAGGRRVSFDEPLDNIEDGLKP